ncbi:MAG: B12-binding domain-containing radical SAM protein [Bacteroidales bacterium]|nr:B12-binding domain-containing radical SAM protein [Bacteroidales bacterium]
MNNPKVDLLLINPCSVFLNYKKHEQLGLGYIKSYLEQNGHSVLIYDMNFSDPNPEAVYQCIKDFDINIVGITIMVGKVKNSVLLLNKLRQLGYKGILIAGGFVPTFESEMLFQQVPTLNTVVIGEGELTINELVKCIKADMNWREINGLGFENNKKLTFNKPRDLIANLDLLPFPSRSPYIQSIGVASLLSSRGCYGNCSFCAIQKFYRIHSYSGIRLRSIINVVDEIESIISTYGITTFLFIDDNFLGCEKFIQGRINAFCREIRTRNLRINFEVSARSNDLKYQLVKELKKEGLSRVYIGLESGSVNQLKRYNKGNTIKDNGKAVKMLLRVGLKIDFGFIPFDPYMKIDDIINNLKFLTKNNLITSRNLNTITFSCFVYKGTQIYNKTIEDSLLLYNEELIHGFRFNETDQEAKLNYVMRYFQGKEIIQLLDQFANTNKFESTFEIVEIFKIDSFCKWLFSLWATYIINYLKGKKSDEVRFYKSEALLYNFLKVNFVIRQLPEAHVTDSLELNRLQKKIGYYIKNVLASKNIDSIPKYLLNPYFADLTYQKMRKREYKFSQYTPNKKGTSSGEITIELTQGKSFSSIELDVFISPDAHNEFEKYAPVTHINLFSGAVQKQQTLFSERLIKGWNYIRFHNLKNNTHLTIKIAINSIKENHIKIRNIYII